MALTPSIMVPLGTPAPDFCLPDTQAKLSRLEHFAEAPVLIVAFICNHCPYVIHLRQDLAKFGREMASLGVAMVAINANDAERYPGDSPEKMADEVRQIGYTFPYLYDQSQAVARAYGAVCTPDFFVFDAQRRLAYRGQFDDSRPGNGVAVTGKDLRAATKALLQGLQPASIQRPSVGCNIKWKSDAAHLSAGATPGAD